MLLSKVLHLLAPTATDGGGASTDTESDPSGLTSWMTALPALDSEAPKGTNGPPNDKSGGTGNAGVPGADGAPPPANPKPAAADAPGKSADAPNKPAAPAEVGKSEAEKKAAEVAESIKNMVDEGKTDDEKWPRNSSDWAKFKIKHAEKETALKKEVETREGKLKELQTQLTTLQEKASKSGEVPPEITSKLERIERENKEMSDRLILLDVTQHPRFQSHFKERIDEQKAQAKSIVGEERSAEFEKILALQDSDFKNERLEAFVDNLPVLQQSRIGAVLNNLDTINRDRQREIDKAGEHHKTLENQQSTKAKNNIAARDKLTGEVLKTLQDEKEGIAIFQNRPEDAAWNAGVSERIAAAKKLLTGESVTPHDIVQAAFHAVAFPDLLKVYSAQMKEYDESISKLQAQVKALTSAQPHPGGGSVATAGAGGGDAAARPSSIKAGQSPDEAMSGFIGGLWKASEAAD